MIMWIQQLIGCGIHMIMKQTAVLIGTIYAKTVSARWQRGQL